MTSRGSTGLLFSPTTRRRLIISVAGSVVVAAMEVLGVLAILPLMQLLTGTRRDGALGWVSRRLGDPSDTRLAVVMALFVFGAFTLKGLSTIAFRWWLLGFLNVQEAQTSTRMLAHYMAAPYWLHLQRNTATMVRTMNDAVSQTYSNVVAGYIGTISELATIGGVCLVLVVVMPVPALLAVAYFGLVGLALQGLVRGRASRAGVVLLETSERTYQSAFHALGGVKEIKVRRRADHFVEEYGAARVEFAGARRTALFLTELPRYVLELAFTLGIAVLTLTIFLLTDADQSVTVLALFVAAGFRMLPSIVRVVAMLSSIRMGRRGMELVLADLAEFDDPALMRPDGEHPLQLAEAVRFDRVSFRYPGTDVPVLTEIEFDIPSGTSVGVVGSSGAGKSTLVDLLLGLHEPTAGRILVDGADIAGSIADWQRAIGMVPQDVYLLDDSLRSNVAFGERADRIDPDRLADAIELAQLDTLVAELPEGLDTFVGERGVRLSGGQRQRIGIARALYLRPQLLVLDEATSALDNETERRISETIDSLQGRMTIVIVAHRLSTVRNCDRIVFLADGRVAAIGSFDEVMEASADFANLVELGDLGADASQDRDAR